MPLAVYSLFLATFCIGTTEVVIAGLLPTVAIDMQADVPTTGFLITGYALSVAILGPFLTVATARFPRRTTILAVMALFVLGHVIAALAPNYPVMLVARILTAMAHGCFFGLAVIVAVGLAPEGRSGRAMSLVFLGITVANLLGVPAGTFIGNALGWRATFWIIGAIAAVATLAIALLVPGDKSGDRKAIPVAAQFRALGNMKVLTSFAIIVFAWIALWSMLTFIAQLVLRVGGSTHDMVSVALLAFGAGATVGIILGGRLADVAPVRTIALSLPAAAALFVVAWLVASNVAAFCVVVFVIGATLCLTVSPLQNRVLQGAAAAPDLASTLTSSAYNAGIAGGAFVGAMALNAGGFGYDAIPLIAAISAAIAALICWLAFAADRRAVPATARPLKLRSVDDRRAAERHLLDDERVFTAPVLEEPEHAVAAVEAAAQRQLRAVIGRHAERQRRRIGEDRRRIGDGRERVRLAAEAGRVFGQQRLVARVVDRRIDGTRQVRRVGDIGVGIPVCRADDLHCAGRDPRFLEQHPEARRRRAVGEEQRVDVPLLQERHELRDDASRFGFRGKIVDRDGVEPEVGDGLPERALLDAAEIGVGEDAREGPLALRLHVGHRAAHFALGQDVEEIDAGRRRAGVVGEADERDARRARHRACGGHLVAAQRPEDEARAFLHRLARRLRRATGLVAGVLEDDGDIVGQCVGLFDVLDRQLRRVRHRGADGDERRVAAQRQEQRHPHRSLAESLSRRRGQGGEAGRRRRRAAPHAGKAAD
jgi:DHA1 family inner membrane transport protein